MSAEQPRTAAPDGAPQAEDSGVVTDLESTSELPVLDAAGIEAFAQHEASDGGATQPNPALPPLTRTAERSDMVADALLRDVQLASARAELAADAAPPALPDVSVPAAVTRSGSHDSVAGELDRLRRALHESEARALRYLEQLQSRQVRSAVVDSVHLEQAARIEAQEATIERLEREIKLAHSRAVELQADLRARLGRAGELERALALQSADARKAQDRIDELEAMAAEAAALRSLAAERQHGLPGVQASQADLLGRVTAAEAAVQERDTQIAEQQHALRLLQAECNAGLARREELEADLRAAEDAIHRLEAELRNRSARLGELERVRNEQRMQAADVQHAMTDVHVERHAREPMPDGARRMLIRSDGGAEVVHVLARKTSIGRTLDNDVQIEASFVSRHHAVILAGPASTVIEDLNSTNGVLVNGHRITRQTLADGDEVMIGRTRFRFAVR